MIHSKHQTSNIKDQRSTSAFTLIELLIVITILGILAALVSGNFINSLKKGRDAKRKQDLHQIQTSIEMFYEDKHVYPATISFGEALCEVDCSSDTEKQYMVKVPVDPQNVPGKGYSYCVPVAGNSYQLYAKLENINDSQIITPAPAGICTATSTACTSGSGPSSSGGCNYGLSSPNAAP